MHNFIILALIIILSLLILLCLYQYGSQFIITSSVCKYCIMTKPIKEEYITTIDEFIDKIIIKGKSKDSNEIITILKINNKEYDIRLLRNENYLLTFKYDYSQPNQSINEIVEKQRISIITDVNAQITLTISTLSPW